jgi:hypothetical protein
LTKHPEEYAAPAHEVGMRMKQARVDLARLVSA